jgi:hypothetical protein
MPPFTSTSFEWHVHTVQAAHERGDAYMCTSVMQINLSLSL